MTENSVIDDNIDIIDLRDHYFRVGNEIFEMDLDVYEIGVYALLCRFTNNDTKISYPSFQKIAEKLKISRRKAVKVINSLVDKGVIMRQGGRTGVSNKYCLLNLSSARGALVHEVHQGSARGALGVVHEVHPKKTKYKKTNKKTNTVTIDDIIFPNELNNDEFKKTYDDWLQLRKEKRNPLTPTVIKKQLSMLSKYPLDKALEILNKSLCNGWTGLFPDKNFKSTKSCKISTMRGA